MGVGGHLESKLHHQPSRMDQPTARSRPCKHILQPIANHRKHVINHILSPLHRLHLSKHICHRCVWCKNRRFHRILPQSSWHGRQNANKPRLLDQHSRVGTLRHSSAISRQRSRKNGSRMVWPERAADCIDDMCHGCNCWSSNGLYFPSAVYQRRR